MHRLECVCVRFLRECIRQRYGLFECVLFFFVLFFSIIVQFLCCLKIRIPMRQRWTHRICCFSRWLLPERLLRPVLVLLAHSHYVAWNRWMRNCAHISASLVSLYIPKLNILHTYYKCLIFRGCPSLFGFVPPSLYLYIYLVSHLNGWIPVVASANRFASWNYSFAAHTRFPLSVSCAERSRVVVGIYISQFEFICSVRYFSYLLFDFHACEDSESSSTYSSDYDKSFVFSFAHSNDWLAQYNYRK